jgi:OPT oligopeptide transporter protein
MHALLFNFQHIVEALKNTVQPKRRKERLTDIHYRLISVYPEVPQWWYICVFIISFVMAYVALVKYVPEAPKWVDSESNLY